MDAFQDKWPRWRQLTSTAAHRGVLCFGPNKGRNVTYTNPHRWLPGFRPVAGPEAVRPARPALPPRVRTCLARALRAGGWASRRAGARAAFEALGDELEAVEVDGERAFVAAGDTAGPVETGRGHPPPPLLRRLRGRRPAAGTPVPWRGGRTGADPVRPGRELPGAARRRRRRRRLAPAAVRQAGRDHGGAAARAHGCPTTRPRCGGGARRPAFSRQSRR